MSPVTYKIKPDVLPRFLAMIGRRTSVVDINSMPSPRPERFSIFAPDLEDWNDFLISCHGAETGLHVRKQIGTDHFLLTWLIAQGRSNGSADKDLECYIECTALLSGVILVGAPKSFSALYEVRPDYARLLLNSMSPTDKAAGPLHVRGNGLIVPSDGIENECGAYVAIEKSRAIWPWSKGALRDFLDDARARHEHIYCRWPR